MASFWITAFDNDAQHHRAYPIFLLIGVLADGCVRDPAVAGRLADDLLAAHRAHLPQFA